MTAYQNYSRARRSRKDAISKATSVVIIFRRASIDLQSSSCVSLLRHSFVYNPRTIVKVDRKTSKTDNSIGKRYRLTLRMDKVHHINLRGWK